METLSGGVRADGAVAVASPGLSSGGFGAGLDYSPTWSNQAVFAVDRQISPQGGQNGSGQVVSQLPWLIRDGTTVVALTGCNNSIFFDFDGSAYRARFFLQDTLRQDRASHTFVLTDTTGDQFTFHDFSGAVPASQRGQLDHFTDPAGNPTAVTAVTAGGEVAEVQRSSTLGGTPVTESYAYSYVPAGGANAGLLSHVTLRRGPSSTGPWTTVRQIDYAYYAAGDPNGNAGDLKTATLQDGADPMPQTLDMTYYRYYVADGGGGYRDGLKSVFTYASYRRLVAAVGDPTAASDDQVNPYADRRYQYDSQHRVAQAVVQGAGCSSCTGGVGSYAYSYTASGNAPGYNSWAVKTVESLPDNSATNVSRNITYTNAYGEVMLSVYEGGAPGNTRQWATFDAYDGQGRLLLQAEPSAVLPPAAGDSYDNHPDLLNQTGGQYQ
jgi:hypothetical protein